MIPCTWFAHLQFVGWVPIIPMANLMWQGDIGFIELKPRFSSDAKPTNANKMWFCLVHLSLFFPRNLILDSLACCFESYLYCQLTGFTCVWLMTQRHPSPRWPIQPAFPHFGWQNYSMLQFLSLIEVYSLFSQWNYFTFVVFFLLLLMIRVLLCQYFCTKTKFFSNQILNKLFTLRLLHL